MTHLFRRSGTVRAAAMAAFVVFSAVAGASAGLSQVLLVAPLETGIFGSSDPTPTFLWPGRDATAVLIMIPGGEGHLGLTPERTDLGGFYGKTLKRLSDPSLTSGRLDVVVFDSPYRIPVGDSYPTARSSPDHLSRIESVVRYYKEKLAKPVWLMGHSNGAASVTEFWKSIHGGEKEKLVDGMVISSARNGISLPDDTALPVLFLHHRKDGCLKSEAHRSNAVHERLKANGNGKTEYAWITGGESETANACHSGHHMYFGAGAEAADAIDRFVTRHTAQR